jgi:hypothetical protein
MPGAPVTTNWAALGPETSIDKKRTVPALELVTVNDWATELPTVTEPNDLDVGDTVMLFVVT